MMIAEAIHSLRPSAAWTLDGDTYEGLTWLDSQQLPPSKEEVLIEAERLRLRAISLKYQVERRHNYPPLSEFADAMYWASKGDQTKLDAYYAACEAVKISHPKTLI
jgi:hypothetical protein